MTRISKSQRVLLAAAGLFLLLVAIDHFRRRQAASPAVNSAVALTKDGGLATDPALSSDGKLLAYASDRAGGDNLDIWVRPLAGGEPRRLTTWPEDDSQPDFSPDGRQIAFHSDHDKGGTYVVDASGGEPKLLAPEGRQARFSPDGRRLAYCDREGHLQVMPAGGGEARPLAPKLDAARFPLWSPDGTHILFSARRERHTEWWVAPADGGEPVNTGATGILQVQGFSRNPEPGAWTAEGVLFAGRFRDAVSLWLAPITNTYQCSGTARRIAETPVARVAASRNGTVVVAGLTTRNRIWSLDKSGRLQPLDTETAPKDRVAVSPDGRNLIYWTADGARGKDLAKGAERKLDDVEGTAVLAGERIIYRREGAIRSAPVAGGDPKELCEHCGDPWSLSSDGSRLLYRSGWQRGVGLLYTATGEKREILRRNNDERNFAWAQFSPDSRWMLLETMQDHGKRQIQVAPFRDGASPQKSDWIVLSDGTNEDRAPCWAADGSTVYFISDRDGFRCLWSRKPGREPLAVHHFHQSKLQFGQTNLAASKERLYFVLSESSGELQRINR